MKSLLVKLIKLCLRRYNVKGLSKLRERTVAYDIKRRAGLKDYQRRDTPRVLGVIFDCFRVPRKIKALDIGCSAEVTKYIGGYVKEIVGINVGGGWLKTDHCPPNVQLLQMNGCNLEFADATFDFIFSVNLNEHISDLSKCLDEQLRVLKSSGYTFAKWEPIWSSARGHHIHEDMVERWEKEKGLPNSNYRNNGTFIQDWSHLLLSKQEMAQAIKHKFKSQAIVDAVVHYIYSDSDLNRNFFDDIERAFKAKKLRIVFWTKSKMDPPPDVLANLRKKHAYSDFSTKGCEVLSTRL